MIHRTLALLLIVGTLTAAEQKPESKRHDFRGDTLLTAPPNAKPTWRPSARVPVNDSISVLYAIDMKDMELFECTSDNRDVRVSLAVDEKGKGIRVGIRSGERNAGKKASARVSWIISDLRGRTQRGYMDVVFE